MLQGRIHRTRSVRELQRRWFEEVDAVLLQEPLEELIAVVLYDGVRTFGVVARDNKVLKVLSKFRTTTMLRVVCVPRALISGDYGPDDDNEVEM